VGQPADTDTLAGKCTAGVSV